MQQYPQDPNIGELISLLITQVEQLLSAHLRLMRQELAADGKKFSSRSAGIVIGVLLAFIGFLFIPVSLMKGLEYWLAPWLSALVVALLFMSSGGLLAFASIKRLGQTRPVERTIEETQETIAWLTRKQ